MAATISNTAPTNRLLKRQNIPGIRIRFDGIISVHSRFGDWADTRPALTRPCAIQMEVRFRGGYFGAAYGV